MKNLKVLLITSLIVLAMISYADNEPPKAKKITRIAIELVSTVPGLTWAVYSQVTPALIKVEKPGYYYAVVKHGGQLFLVFGTRKAWARFFNTKPAPKNVGQEGFPSLTRSSL